ncbi:MAG: hypothetical protein WAV38_03130 [Xanthobacteraceae bacterium]
MLLQHRKRTGGQEDRAGARLALRQFDPQSMLLGLFDCALDAELARVKIDVGPLQSHQLAAPDARSKQYHDLWID